MNPKRNGFTMNSDHGLGPKLCEQQTEHKAIDFLSLKIKGELV